MYNICKAERSALVTSTWEYKIDISWLPYSNYGAVLMYTCTLTSLQTYTRMISCWFNFTSKLKCIVLHVLLSWSKKRNIKLPS